MTGNQVNREVDALFESAIALARSDEDPQANEYWRAIRTLHGRPEPAVFTRACECCKSPSPAERVVGVDVLAQLGSYEPGRGRPFALGTVALLCSLLTDESEDVIASAVHALSHHQAGTASDLGALASRSSRDIRWAVACALRSDEDPSAIPVLLSLMKDEDAGVRDWATFSLGTQSVADSAEIRSALTLCLRDPDREVRGEAMAGLARRNDKSVIGYIVEALGGDDATQLAFDAADEILKMNPGEPQILAALAKWRTE